VHQVILPQCCPPRERIAPARQRLRFLPFFCCFALLSFEPKGQGMVNYWWLAGYTSALISIILRSRRPSSDLFPSDVASAPCPVRAAAATDPPATPEPRGITAVFFHLSQRSLSAARRSRRCPAVDTPAPPSACSVLESPVPHGHISSCIVTRPNALFWSLQVGEPSGSNSPVPQRGLAAA
jgi:hypothetical protein